MLCVAGPAVAEIILDQSRSVERPAESFIVFAADKWGPGAYNLPLYLAFADPMYCGGLMLPPMIKGYRFPFHDMDNTAGHSLIQLRPPPGGYPLAALPPATEALCIYRTISPTQGEGAVA